MAVMLGVAIPPVSAVPVSNDRQAEFNRIQTQIDQIDQQLDVIVEEYNAAALALSKTQSELRSCSAELKAAEEKLARTQAVLNSRIASAYREGGLSYLEILINAKDINQFFYCLGLLERLTNQDVQIIAELRESEKETTAQRAILLEKEKKQRAIVTEIKGKKDRIASSLRERNNLLANISNELSQQRRAEARDQAKLRKKLKLSYGPRSGVSVSRGGGRARVVDLAMEELGKPYSWGASGPNSFDCSGLTQYVYGKIGISLPHSSRAQYGSGQHVSRGELQPGDLVFFARGSTISHVGIYVGGDNFIHAPRTGDVVKIDSISSRGGYVGAVRP
ncbi:MAG: C40 family peptidase [Actinobacteria bacterium]|nr:C40 family peptidase [Actinomycetota bacterium]